MSVDEIINHENINYSIIRDNELQVGLGLEVSPYTSAVPRDFQKTKISIPSHINKNEKKYRVTKVGAHAFYGCSNITIIELPFTVEILARSCFGVMQSLEIIIIPSNTRLHTIDKGVFHKCLNLENFFIPSSVKYIYERTFWYASTTFWYSGMRKFNIDFEEYNKSIHVPYSYAHESFGNLSIVKDYAWKPCICNTIKYNNHFNIITLAVYFFILSY